MNEQQLKEALQGINNYFALSEPRPREIYITYDGLVYTLVHGKWKKL